MFLYTFVDLVKEGMKDRVANKLGTFSPYAQIPTDMSNAEFWKTGMSYNSDKIIGLYSAPTKRYPFDAWALGGLYAYVHLATYTKIDDKWIVKFSENMPPKIRNVMNTMLAEAGLPTESSGGE